MCFDTDAFDDHHGTITQRVAGSIPDCRSNTRQPQALALQTPAAAIFTFPNSHPVRRRRPRALAAESWRGWESLGRWW